MAGPSLLCVTSSTECSGSYAPVRLGATCRADTLRHLRATVVFNVGFPMVSCREYSLHSTRTCGDVAGSKTSRALSTEPTFPRKGGSCVGRSRAGKTTKVMALADRNGLPLAVAIADGSRHDSVLTDRTLDAAFVAELPPRLIADKAWDGAALQKRLLEERGIELIAPKKRNSRRRQDGRPLRRYRRRWKVERLFAWLKRKRRLSVRWERKAENFLGMLQLGCATLLLRRIAR